MVTWPVARISKDLPAVSLTPNATRVHTSQRTHAGFAGGEWPTARVVSRQTLRNGSETAHLLRLVSQRLARIHAGWRSGSVRTFGFEIWQCLMDQGSVSWVNLEV